MILHGSQGQALAIVLFSCIYSSGHGSQSQIFLSPIELLTHLPKNIQMMNLLKTIVFQKENLFKK